MGKVKKANPRIVQLFGMVVFAALITYIVSFLASSPAHASCAAGITTSGDITLNLVPGGTSISSGTITINTDCELGYQVLIGGPSDATLYRNGDNTSEDYIAPSTGTISTPTSLSTDTYGYSLDSSATPSSNSYIGLTDSRETIFSKNSASASGGDTYNIAFGASIASDMPYGIYSMTNSGEITYYVVANLGTIVTLDANGGDIPAGPDWTGSGSSATKEVNPNSTYGALPTPTKQNYTFLAWAVGPPSAYQTVDYIESTGTQYIDTGVGPSNTKGVYAKLSTSNTSTDAIYFGSKVGDQDTRFWVGNQNGQIYYGFNTNTFKSGLSANTVNEINFNYLNERKSTFNGTQIADYSQRTLSSLNNKNIFIFAGNNPEQNSDTDSPNYYSRIKLNKLKISDGSEVIHNYDPCYRKSDGEIGLYDLIGQGFYTNDGTGTFNKGSDTAFITSENADDYKTITSSDNILSEKSHTLYAIWGHAPTVTFETYGGSVSPATKEYAHDSYYTDLPTPVKTGYTFHGWLTKPHDYNLSSEYKEVEYVESTGDRYIELPFGFDRTDKIDFDVSIDSSHTNDKFMITPKTWNNNNNRFAMGGVYSSKYTVGFGSRSTQNAPLSPVTANDGGRHQWHYDNSVFTISDLNLSLNLASATFGGTTANLRLYYGYNASTKGKIYRYIHWKNDIKVIDLIPVYRVSDNVAGLYDVIGDVFYEGEGSGTFNAGGDIENEVVGSSTKVVTNDNHTLYALWTKDE